MRVSINCVYFVLFCSAFSSVWIRVCLEFHVMEDEIVSNFSRFVSAFVEVMPTVIIRHFLCSVYIMQLCNLLYTLFLVLAPIIA